MRRALTSLSQSSSTDLSFTWLGAPTTFANADFSKFIRSEVNPVDGVTEWVMMEDSGPGAITRWWMTGDYLSAGNIRVYIDGATEPVLDGEFRSLLGANAAFGPELSLVSRPGDYSGHNLYAPIPYTHDVKVTYRGPQGKTVLQHQLPPVRRRHVGANLLAGRHDHVCRAA